MIFRGHFQRGHLLHHISLATIW